MSPSTADPIVARFWTRARRFPRLIGKTVNGDRIPGGPYTTAQAIGGFLTVWLLWESRSLWGQGSVIAELVFIAGMGWGVVWVLGKVPLNSRNPIVLAGGLVYAVFSPRRGRSAGRGLGARDFGPGPRRVLRTRAAPVWNGRLPGTPFGHAEQPAVPDPPVVESPALLPDAPVLVTAEDRLTSSSPEEPVLTGLQRLLADAARTPANAAATGRADDDWVHAGARVHDTVKGES